MGTESSPITRDTPGLARSSSESMPLSRGTPITTRLPANSTGLSTRPASNNACGCSVDAAANTSIATPLEIWAAMRSDPAKVVLTDGEDAVSA